MGNETQVRPARRIALLAACCVHLALPARADPATGWTTGGKSVLIIPAAFTDCPAPGAPAGGWTNLMADVNAFYRRQSYSNYWISQVAICPAVDLGVSYTNYAPYHTWQDTAFLPDVRAQARLAGYDTADYDLEIVHTWLPSVASNGIAVRGKGMHLNVPAGDGKAWITVPHELGHNLGLFHNRGADSASYLPGTYQKEGYWLAEYGGYLDVMGASDLDLSGIGEFCAFYKNWLGWLPDGQVVSPATSGTYRIHAFDQGVLTPGDNYAMRIEADEEYTYWFEFRQAVTNNPWSMSGLAVYWGGESLLSAGRYAYQLDMTPGSRGCDNPGKRNATDNNMADAPLALGRTFSDENRNLHVTPVRKGGTLPESLDVVVRFGPFPTNGAPSLSIAATTLTPATGQVVTFTATAADPDGDELAYYWEFDDPSAPDGSGQRPFGLDPTDPDSTLRTSASYAWPSNCSALVRCTASDLKGGRTIASARVTVGGGGGLTITGTVRDELGNPVAGAVVNNLKLGALLYSATNFVASGETDTNGAYLIQVRNGLTYRLLARHRGHTFACNTPGGSATGTVTLAGASVTNVNFTRVKAMRTIGGPVYLEGAHPRYDPALHGMIAVHGGTNHVPIGTNGYWNMVVPEGPIALSFTPPPGGTLRYGFRNPYEVIETFTNLALFLDLSNAVSSVGFASSQGARDEADGPVDIPVVLTLPPGYTNATWPPNLWLGVVLGGSDSARYGVDYRLLPMEVRFSNNTSVLTQYLSLAVHSNGAPQSRLVTIRLEPLNVTTHPGPRTTYTHAILAPGADADVDGLPDAWEWTFGASLTGLQAAADLDSDGLSNLHEYLADTSPVDGTSALRLTDIREQTGGVRIQWKGGSNAWQYLEHAPRVTDNDPAWAVIHTGAPPTATTSEFLQADGPVTGRFYRIRAAR